MARLQRHPDGRPYLLKAKAEFLLDYLCARGMGLLATAYWNREEVVEDIDGVNPALHQGQMLIANCASAATAIATLLARLLKSEKDKGNWND